MKKTPTIHSTSRFAGRTILADKLLNIPSQRKLDDHRLHCTLPLLLPYPSTLKMRISILLFLFTLFSSVLSAQPERLIANRLTYASHVIQALSFSQATDENRLFVVLQSGKIMVYENGLVETPFLDLSSTGADVVDFGIGSEEGLLSMALDPDYETNGYFYVVYTGYLPDGSGGNSYDWRLLRFRRSMTDPYMADPDWWEEILFVPMIRRGHNAGAMFFGDDGMLYVSIGDGGSTGTGAPGGNSNGDADNNAQNLNTLLGKILRIDVSGEAPYSIPPDNPFVNDQNARPEVWSYGFRNPWRWSFDRATGDMFIGDVGEVDWEEISHEPGNHPGGANYGWRLLEGPECYNPVDDCDPENETVLPIHAYQHDGEVCSVIGGFRYRGTKIPSLAGHYIYSDACGFGDAQFWLLSQSGANWSSRPVEVEVEGGFVPWDETRFGFGQDNQGELYICTRLALYKIAFDPDDESTIPDDGTDLIVFPNPSRGQVTIDLGADLILEEVQFYDLNGRMVDIQKPLTGGTQFYSLNISTLSAGMYIVKAKILGFPITKTGKMIVLGEDE